MTNKPELKPCPFCGGEAKLEQTGRTQITVSCTSCHVKRVQKVLRQSLEWLEGKQVAAWNHRPSQWVRAEDEPIPVPGNFDFLVYDGGSVVKCFREYAGANECITHWQPLPPPPEEE